VVITKEGKKGDFSLFYFMKPFALMTHRMYSEKLDRDVEITVFSSGNAESSRPLIIMHDGQNLFFDKLATYGTCWGLLKVLAKEDFPDCVLAGITCAAGSLRLDEYGPFLFDLQAQVKTGFDYPVGGKGDAHLRFVYDELIPRLRNEYVCEEKIYIGGSSMGGVIACYAALTYPERTAGIFGLSNAFWVACDPFVEKIGQFTGVFPAIYLDQGDRESDDADQMTNIRQCEQRVETALAKRHPLLMRCETITNGTHNEASWRLRIEEILRWILKK
jgi:predicted alpha/beta superfamily hydrolase